MERIQALDKGLYCGSRWFYPDVPEVQVDGIYSEHRDLHADDRFQHQAPYRLNNHDANIHVICPELTLVAAKEATGDRLSLDCLQMADVLTGACSQGLDASNKKDGCNRVGREIRARVEKQMDKPHNTRSCCYKRFAMSFFPETLPGTEVSMWGVRNGGMYKCRHVRLQTEGQKEFDLGL